MNLNELKNLIKEGTFYSPTKGAMDLRRVINELIVFKKEDTNANYKIVLGTDSEKRDKSAEFVCVVAIHRIRKGGRYFWLRIFDNRNLDLRTRIYQEATISLALAGALLETELEIHNVEIDMGKPITDIFKSFEKDAGSVGQEVVFSNELEIHVDIGTVGPTREMIKEITGMIRGSGFSVKIKPESFAASNLADRHI